jgi:hypothetical protein
MSKSANRAAASSLVSKASAKKVRLPREASGVAAGDVLPLIGNRDFHHCVLHVGRLALLFPMPNTAAYPGRIRLDALLGSEAIYVSELQTPT